MRYSLPSLLLAMALASSAFADDQAAEKKSPAYKPRLSEIMSITQLQQYKLWYAARNGNWALAKYEAEKMKESIQDAISLYPGLPATDMTTLDKPTTKLDAAIKAKNSPEFVQAFHELTAACNGCHRSQGLDFIMIRVPTASPHRNQVITPQ